MLSHSKSESQVTMFLQYLIKVLHTWCFSCALTNAKALCLETISNHTSYPMSPSNLNLKMILNTIDFSFLLASTWAQPISCRRYKSHEAFIQNEPLYLITARLSNWRSAVNILCNQCHQPPLPTEQPLTLLVPTCLGSLKWWLYSKRLSNSYVELPPSYVSAFSSSML